MDDPGAIRDHGWRQGSVIASANASARFSELLQDERHAFTHWIVLSQDCDVVHRSYEAEPLVELLGCKVIQKADGTFTSGKNPRRLHLGMHIAGKHCVLEARVSDRYCVDRRVLETMGPSNECSLEKATVDTIADWIARRCNRSAFPDAFNERLRPKQKGFKEVLVKHGEVLEGIYFALDPRGELPVAEKYRVGVRLVMLVEQYNEPAQLDRALRTRSAFEIGLEQCEGISVESVEVVAANEFTLADMLQFVPWDGFDYLSNADASDDVA